MLVQASQGQFGSAHVVVLARKGRFGKIHDRSAYRCRPDEAGHGSPPSTSTAANRAYRYINNRHAWARRTGIDLELPVLLCNQGGVTMQIADNETSELSQFMDAVSASSGSFDSSSSIRPAMTAT